MNSTSLSFTFLTTLFTGICFGAGNTQAATVADKIAPFALTTGLPGTSATSFNTAMESALAKPNNNRGRNNRGRGKGRSLTFQPNGGKTIQAAPTLSKADQDKLDNNPLDYLNGTGLSKETPLHHEFDTKKAPAPKAKSGSKKK